MAGNPPRSPQEAKTIPNPPQTPDYDSLPPGADLDALVAERVMGWHRYEKGDTKEWPGYWHSADGKKQELCEPDNDYYYPEYPWSPSTDIAAAWQVVERIAGYSTVDRCPLPRGVEYEASFFDGQTDHTARAATAPLAVCRAALKATAK